jgi:hypothetical protein
VEIGEGRVLVNVQFIPPTGEEIYMVLARSWPGVGIVLYCPKAHLGTLIERA